MESGPISSFIPQEYDKYNYVRKYVFLVQHHMYSLAVNTSFDLQGSTLRVVARQIQPPANCQVQYCTLIFFQQYGINIGQLKSTLYREGVGHSPRSTIYQFIQFTPTGQTE